MPSAKANSKQTESFANGKLRQINEVKRRPGLERKTGASSAGAHPRRMCAVVSPSRLKTPLEQSPLRLKPRHSSPRPAVHARARSEQTIPFGCEPDSTLGLVWFLRSLRPVGRAAGVEECPICWRALLVRRVPRQRSVHKGVSVRGPCADRHHGRAQDPVADLPARCEADRNRALGLV